MSSQDLITQDMLEVLAQVQTDPQSKLFAKGIKLGAPQSTEQPLTGKEPFLSAAERKLIRAHRERVEAFLYARADKALLDSEWGKRMVVNPNDPCPSTQGGPLSSKGLSLSPETSQKVEESLAAIAHPVSDLHLGLSLKPSFHGRILLAIALLERGRYQQASSQLQAASKRAPTAKDRSLVHMNRAHLAWEVGNLQEVFLSYRRASRDSELDLYPKALQLVAAVGEGQPNWLREADAALKGWNSQSIEEFMPDALRICHNRAVTAPASSLNKPLQSEFGQRLLDALAAEDE